MRIVINEQLKVEIEGTTGILRAISHPRCSMEYWETNEMVDVLRALHIARVTDINADVLAEVPNYGAQTPQQKLTARLLWVGITIIPPQMWREECIERKKEYWNTVHEYNARYGSGVAYQFDH